MKYKHWKTSNENGKQIQIKLRNNWKTQKKLKKLNEKLKISKKLYFIKNISDLKKMIIKKWKILKIKKWKKTVN